MSRNTPGSWTTWSDAEVEYVKNFWGKKSARDIAAVLGTKTRNAVIGKAHRMGLEESPFKQQLSRRPKVANDNTMNKPPPKRLPKAPTRLPKEAPLPVGLEPIGIMELNVNTCRAVVGRDHKGIATYCGAQVFSGKVWCPGHCVLYFRGDDRRRSA